MAKITLADLASTNAGSLITAINNNNTLLEAAIENTLSRDGTTPNEMNTSFDMNSNRVYNLPAASADTEPVRLGEFNTFVLAMDAAVTSAAASATSAAASYDNFDDRYLGAKSSAPTVDNDGNVLLVGALYWSTITNSFWVWSGTSWGSLTPPVSSLTAVIDGGGLAITTGVKGYLEVPFACTISEATALADQVGSIVVDVWKDTYANYPPVDADSITAAAPITISSAIKSKNTTLVGWTTSVAAGDILGFNVDSASTVTRVTISLKATKT